jgi:hypothetical protein
MKRATQARYLGMVALVCYVFASALAPAVYGLYGSIAGRRVMRGKKTIRLLLTLLLLLGTTDRLHAHQIWANAEISGQPDGDLFDYTLTLNNTGTSTSQIETFYFCWEGPTGHNLMPSSPTNVLSVAGWTAQVTNNGASDGYAILFKTTTAPLNPNSSLTFDFQSADSLAVLQGVSPFDGHAGVMTCFLYSGPGLMGVGAQLTAEVVPEPSPSALLTFGLLGVLLAGWRKRPN